MIIKCQACQARFRLDESKIKGKGARIRCRKCGESIIVMKSDIPPPQEYSPAKKEHFDLRAVLQEPTKRPPLQPRDAVDTAFESTLGRERETEQVQPPTPEEPVVPSLKQDEVDAAFEKILGRERETEQAPAPVTEEPAPPEEEAQETFAQEPTGQIFTPDETSAGIESPLFREEEEQPAPVAEEPAPPEEEAQETFAQEPADLTLARDEVDAAFEGILGKEQETGQETPSITEEGTLPREAQDISSPLELGKDGDISPLQQKGETPVGSPEDSAGGEAHPPPLAEEKWDHPDQHEAGFLNLDTTLPDFLKRGEAAREPGKQFDISERLSDTPIGVEGEDIAPFFPAPDSPESPVHSLDPADSRAETIRDQLSDLVDGTSTEETSVPDSPPPEMSSPQPMEIESKPVIRPRPSAPSGKPSVALMALLFVVLAGGGAYLAFTESGQQTLRTLIPSMESLWLGGKESVKPYSIGNLIGYYETGDKAGRMFVIKGVATNQGQKKKSGIRIRAELLDGNHQTIAEKTVYGGNIITGLRSAEQETIETAMSNRFGNKLSNVDVAPGKSIPFMLVFFNPPEGIEEYRLEALDGD